jgi:hypothetical protein
LRLALIQQFLFDMFVALVDGFLEFLDGPKPFNDPIVHCHLLHRVFERVQHLLVQRINLAQQGLGPELVGLALHMLRSLGEEDLQRHDTLFLIASLRLANRAHEHRLRDLALDVHVVQLFPFMQITLVAVKIIEFVLLDVFSRHISTKMIVNRN